MLLCDKHDKSGKNKSRKAKRDGSYIGNQIGMLANFIHTCIGLMRNDDEL